MVRVFINGEGKEVPPKLSVLKALELSGAPYRGDCKVLIRKRVEEREEPREYVLETNRGAITVGIEEGALAWWRERFPLFSGKGMWWETNHAVVFGPVDLRGAGVKPSRVKKRFEEGEVFLGFGGFDLSQAFLGFSRRSHEGLYGVPEEVPSLGRVVRGGHLLGRVGRGDLLLRVYPRTKERWEPVQGNPARVEVEEGMEIFTYLKVVLLPEAKVGAEHLLGLSKEGVWRVSQTGSAFLSVEGLPVDTLPPENTTMRFRGTVTVRNSGKRVGSLYLYRKDSPPSPHHSVVGRVEVGTEMLDHSVKGDRFLVMTVPKRMVVVGMTQGEASRFLREEGVRHLRVGDERDEAVIIEQRPELTLEVKEEGMVATLGVDPGAVIRVKLWEEKAPKSVAHFRTVAEMVTSRVGKLSVIALTDEVLLLSSVRGKTFKTLPAENVPEAEVGEGTLGVTNSFRRLTGLLGVRLKPSKVFGPTGEALEATNLIGEVIGSLENLKNREVGDVIYVMEE
ncbi:MAG: methanogenesis marker 3 protein [Candidatus Hadarchaeales archaeon]